MATAKYSPTVHASYDADQNWFKTYAGEDQYDPEGFDAYGYSTEGVDRAGHDEHEYAANEDLYEIVRDRWAHKVLPLPPPKPRWESYQVMMNGKVARMDQLSLDELRLALCDAMDVIATTERLFQRGVEEMDNWGRGRPVTDFETLFVGEDQLED